MEKTHYLKAPDVQRYHLDDIPLFADISSEYVGQFLSVCKVFSFSAHERVLQQGIKTSWVYILLSGKLKVVVNDVEVTVIYQRGDVFGEAPLVTANAPSADVLALTPVKCLAIDTVLLRQVHTKGNEIFSMHFYQFIIKLLIRRLGQMSEELAMVKSIFYVTDDEGQPLLDLPQD